MSNAIPDDKRKTGKYQDVDGGFAWIVLIGCFVMYIFVIGSFKAYGVLYTEMVEHYSSGSGNTAWIGSIAVVLLFGLGPLANVLCKIYTFRRITMIGGILIGLGYFLSGFATRMEYLYLTFISIGIGCGLTFAPCSTIISYYFDKRRALANGITVSGSGIGAITLPFLYKYLIEQYGLKGTFWIIGAIFANVCVAACLFRQPRHLVEERKCRVREDKSCSEENKVPDSRSPIGKIARKINGNICGALDLRCALFRNAVYTLYVTSFMCATFAYTGSFILIPASVKALGYNKTYVALSVTIFGGTELVARILIGWFADLNIIQRKYIYAISMFIGGFFSLFGPLFNNFTFIAIYAVVAATFPGSYFSLISVLIIDIVGLDNFSPAFGLLSLSLAVGLVPSQPTVGWLYDLFENWNSSFILTGCVYILAAVLILLEPVVVRCCTKPDNNDQNENQQQSHSQDRPTDRACIDDVPSSDNGFRSEI